MFSLNFSFTIFSLTIFPLFWKPFTDILGVYELPKVHNKVSNYRKKTLSLLSNYHLTGQFCAPGAPGFSTKLLLNLLKMCPRGTKDFLGTKFLKITRLKLSLKLRLMSRELKLSLKLS